MNHKKPFFGKAKDVCFLIIRYLLIIKITSTGLNIKSNHDVNNEIIYRKSMFIENRDLGEILIYKGQEPADVVYTLGVKHKFIYDNRVKLVNDICKEIKCARSKALLWRTNVTVKINGNSIGASVEEEFVGVFQLYEDVEAVDAAHEFMKVHNLTIEHRNEILEKACKLVECRREPGIFIYLLCISCFEIIVNPYIYKSLD